MDIKYFVLPFQDTDGVWAPDASVHFASRRPEHVSLNRACIASQLVRNIKGAIPPSTSTRLSVAASMAGQRLPARLFSRIYLYGAAYYDVRRDSSKPSKYRDPSQPFARIGAPQRPSASPGREAVDYVAIPADPTKEAGKLGPC